MTTIAEIATRARAARTGPGRWRAKCPAHTGKSETSLSIAEGSGGRPLIYCFGGCDFPSIATALGLERPAAGKIPREEFSPLAAARAEATRRTLSQRWNSRGVLDTYAEADAFRVLGQRIQQVRREARTDTPTTWAKLAYAAKAEDHLRLLEMEIGA